MSFSLLETKDVSAGELLPRQETLARDGADSIDIPPVAEHGFTLKAADAIVPKHASLTELVPSPRISL